MLAITDRNLIILIVLVIVLAAILPTWPQTKNWGWQPAGLLGGLLIVLVVLILLGHL